MVLVYFGMRRKVSFLDTVQWDQIHRNVKILKLCFFGANFMFLVYFGMRRKVSFLDTALHCAKGKINKGQNYRL